MNLKIDFKENFLKDIFLCVLGVVICFCCIFNVYFMKENYKRKVNHAGTLVQSSGNQGVESRIFISLRRLK